MTNKEFEFSVDARKMNVTPVDALGGEDLIPLIEFRRGYITRVLPLDDRERIARLNRLDDAKVPFEVVIATKPSGRKKLVRETQMIYRRQKADLPQIAIEDKQSVHLVPVLSILANGNVNSLNQNLIVVCRPKEQVIGQTDPLYLVARSLLLNTLDEKLG